MSDTQAKASKQVESMRKGLAKRDAEKEFLKNMPWVNDVDKYHSFSTDFPGIGNMSRLPGFMRGQLSAPFPPSAIKDTYKGSKGMSTIKAACQIERMNDVFGIGGWLPDHQVVSIFPRPKYKYAVGEDGKTQVKEGEVDYYYMYALMRVRVYIREFDFYSPWMYGGHAVDDYNQDPADGFKSAVTDGLSKVLGNFFEVGIQIYKGDVHSQVKNTAATLTQAERDRMDREYLTGLTGLKSKDSPAPAPAPAKAKVEERPAEIPAQEGPQASDASGEPAVEDKTEETPPVERKTAPFSLETLKNISAEGLSFTEAAVKLMNDFEVPYAETFEELTGNKKCTKPALIRWYVAFYGKNPIIKTPEVSEESEEASEPAANSNPESAAPAPTAEATQEDEDKGGIDNGTVPPTPDAGNVQSDSEEPPVEIELEAGENEVVTNFKAEFDAYIDFELFKKECKEIWARTKEAKKHGMITQEEHIELQVYVKEIVKNFQSIG